MSYSITKVENEIRTACRKANVPLTVSVVENGRLTRTLGRVIFSVNNVSGHAVPTKIEFSKQLLKTADDRTIRDVLLHETAHYVVTMRTGKQHGHDQLFKDTCAELGTTNDGTATEVTRIVPESQIYKYQIYCPNCDAIVGNYSRRGKVINNIHLCTCKKCGKQDLKVIQNW